MPAWGNPKDVELRNRDGSDIFYTPLYPLAIDRVRRVGEIVAMVVAETTSQARDAAERIVIDYRPLPALADAQAALDPGASPLWDQMTNNVSVDDVKGDQQACDAAFTRAAHIVRLETYNQRVTGVPMEPRAALAEYDAKNGQFTLEAGSQGAIRFRNELAATFCVAPEKVRAVSRDVGGGYGTRNHTYPEFALALWAAKRTGLPVKWVCDRGEGGTTAAPPAVINAMVDALSEFDVRHMDMPATPERIWRAIHQT
jgi:carbon-monoxide dehydrogenase large subunit